MEYNLKEKLEITPDFLEELISKSWQEAESLQQQIANIDSSTKLGEEVTKLLKNMCTSHYVLIGCLEMLADGTEVFGSIGAAEPTVTELPEQETQNIDKLEPDMLEIQAPIENNGNFEPFEYFVDFDEPIGDPLSDEDLYS